MANVDNAFGLRLAKVLHGGEPAMMVCNIPATDSTAVGIGDAVRPAGSAAATLGSEGRMTVDQCAANETILGVVVGVDAESNQANTYREASTSRNVHVCIDRAATYYIQEDSVGGALALTDVGNMADLVVAAVDTTTGSSKMELDSSSVGSGAQVKIIGLANIPGNEIGTNAIWEVVLNEHYLGDSAAGL